MKTWKNAVLPNKVIKLYTIRRLQNRSWQSCSCSAVQFICQMFFPPTAEPYSSVYKPSMQEEVFFINHTPQTKLDVWFSPSASQRRYPCSGSPAVYQDLNTSHDWPVKKGYCSIGKSAWREIHNVLPAIFEPAGGPPEQGPRRCFANVTSQAQIASAKQAFESVDEIKIFFLSWQRQSWIVSAPKRGRLGLHQCKLPPGKFVISHSYTPKSRILKKQT